MHPVSALGSTTRREGSGADVAKRVVILASGETERLALPHLVRHLKEQGVSAGDIRIPFRHRPLNAKMVAQLVQAVWYENIEARPQKFVVLMDTDASSPEDILEPIQAELPSLLQDIDADLQFAYAQQHLEAWYFADHHNLRRHIGRNLGRIDASQPDQILNPKNHLKNLLGQRIYTALESESIAKALSAAAIADRSPNFRGFVSAVLNGDSAKGLCSRQS